MKRKITPAKKLGKGYDLKIDIENTIPYRYFFKKIKNKVYRFSKIGDEEWRKDLMPFEVEPFILLD